MTSYKKIILFFCLIVCGMHPASAQFIHVTGIGMSGRSDILDRIVRPGDSLYFIVDYSLQSRGEINGVMSAEGVFDEIRLHYYTSDPPEGNPISTSIIPVDTSNIHPDPDSLIFHVYFTAALPIELNDAILSMQAVLGLYGQEQDTDTLIVSDIRSSYLLVGGIEPLNNPVDEFHIDYLSVSHEVPDIPVIHFPVDHDTVGRYVNIVYDLPISPDAATLSLQITEILGDDEGEVYTLFLSDNSVGAGKQIQFDALDLNASPDIDSLIGLEQLFDGALYRFQIAYEYDDGVLSDTSTVDSLFLDAYTGSLHFVEPDIGSESPYPNVLVVYDLEEAADTVWLTFEADTLSLISDPLSPHILALIPDYNGAQPQALTLDGTNIGTSNPLVLTSNRGPVDSLVTGVIYNVTLTYGDRFGNDPVSETNYGFVWPEDLATIPPILNSPLSQSADNASVRVDFILPEAPLPGSVALVLQAFPSQPGSPHTVHLGTLGSAGPTGFFLNAQSLSSSDLVTSVEGGDFLTDGSFYGIRVVYQDTRGNDEAQSSFILWTYDNHTEPPVFLAPVEDDTMSFEGTTVIYSQPEDAIPGSLQLVLTQTGGPEIDPHSPHILYLSDTGADTFKVVNFNPAFLTEGEGIDSVHNGGELTPRGEYRMTLRYQDTLANAFAEDFVENLIIASGSSVFARGGELLIGVTPNAVDQPVFYLGLSAEGASALRGLRFRVQGTVQPSDVIASQAMLWTSVDSLLNPAVDLRVDSLDSWTGGDMVFDSFSVGLDEQERFFFVTLNYTANADSTHRVNLLIPSSDYIDCGNDPVFAERWPIGSPDIALPVSFSAFYTEQDSIFGSLKIVWTVESELNNAGFILYRRAENEEFFTEVASFTEFQELYGRGTAATAWLYAFSDRGLTPGVTYIYRIESVSLDGFSVHAYENEATGTPRIPPSSFELHGSYPNPFNQQATIEYVVPFHADVEIHIYDVLGRQVRELVRAQLAPAVYRSVWDGKNDAGISMPSGVYIYQLRGGGVFSEAGKMLLVR